MAIHRSLRVSAVRRNTLAACLAAALATGAAGADPRPAAHEPRPNTPNAALIGSAHTSLLHGAYNQAQRDAVAWMPHFVPSSPTGNVITVDSCADDDDPTTTTLRDAFAAATSNTEIDLSALTCSTISLTNGEIIATVPYLKVRGPGRQALTVQANDASRVFGSNYYGLEISDLTVAHGRTVTGIGGCIRVAGDLTLTRSTVTGCQAGDGTNGASYGAGVDVIGNLYMQSSTISASSATASDTAFGGGAYVYGNASLDDSTIEGNITTTTSSYSLGGGLFARGVVQISDSRVMDNSVSSTDGPANGGGIYSTANVEARFSTISGNTAHSETTWSYGGGIFSGAGSSAVVLHASTLSGNTVSANCDDCIIMGGGATAFGRIFAYYTTVSDNHVLSAASSSGQSLGGGLATDAYGIAGEIGVVNSTVSGNTAIGGAGGNGFGGGIATLGHSLIAATNSTIAFNEASHSGGGISLDSNSLMYSTIVANNQAQGSANDVAPNFAFDSFTISGSDNLVMMASAGITLPPDTILDSDPLLQTTLENNGGPTKTHALDPLSPAIDAGDNLLFSFNYDQRGCPNAREVNGAADIGAFEVQIGTPDYIFGHGFEGGWPLCP